MSKSLGCDETHTIPRNITARRVVFDHGEIYNPKIKNTTVLFSTSQLPIRKIDTIPNHVKKDPSFIDYTGSEYGRFIVLGLLDCKDFNKWVLKCCCGNYEIRRATVLNKPPGKMENTRCQECLDLERLRYKDHKQKYGIYPWQKKAKRRDGKEFVRIEL